MGDHVNISSDEELIIALTEMAGPLYKLTVTVKKPAGRETGGAGGGEEAVHHGVTCDGCDMNPILGPRYKCLVRDDYDLCGRCEASGLNMGNNMMKTLSRSANRARAGVRRRTRRSYWSSLLAAPPWRRW